MLLVVCMRACVCMCVFLKVHAVWLRAETTTCELFVCEKIRCIVLYWSSSVTIWVWLEGVWRGGGGVRERSIQGLLILLPSPLSCIG